jgi:hypothetical protein
VLVRGVNLRKAKKQKAHHDHGCRNDLKDSMLLTLTHFCRPVYTYSRQGFAGSVVAAGRRHNVAALIKCTGDRSRTGPTGQNLFL